jgi:hypothetical protein
LLPIFLDIDGFFVHQSFLHRWLADKGLGGMTGHLACSALAAFPVCVCVCAGSCKVGGAESNCQGSGVIIDDAARVADGAFTAIADCVEEAGNIYQVRLQLSQCMLHKLLMIHSASVGTLRFTL